MIHDRYSTSWIGYSTAWIGYTTQPQLLVPKTAFSTPKYKLLDPNSRLLDPLSSISTHKQSSRPTRSLLDPQAVCSTHKRSSRPSSAHASRLTSAHASQPTSSPSFSTHKLHKLLDSLWKSKTNHEPLHDSGQEYRTQGLQQVQITLVNQPRVKSKNLPRPNGIASSNLSSGLIEHRSGRILQLTTFLSSGHLKRGGDATGKERELGNRRGSFGKKNPSISIYFWKGEK